MNLYEHWLNHPNVREDYKEELRQMNEIQKGDAFFKDVEFGTGGMRGILGAGTNRMNIYTIRKANVAFAKWIAAHGKQACERGVAISYDNRYFSKEFADESARVLAMHNIKSYVFDMLRPTPELSYAVRHLNCFGGIMITASHNPKEYNGYKIYDETGCQLVPEYMDEVIKYIEEIKDCLDITINLTKEQESLINIIGKEIDEPYFKDVESIQLHPELSKDNLSIVFTPQHGTALEDVIEVFNHTGYKYTLVKEQCTHDPAFSGTKSPNPEVQAAYDVALEYCRKVDADIAISTDPDADRIGVVVKHNGEYILMTGNQTGAVLVEYTLSHLAKTKTLPKNPVIINTIVTGDLCEKIANSYNVEIEKTLTGFKFIGDKIRKHEENKDKNFIFGYEESYGYLIKPFVRDKDGIQATLYLAEAANYYKNVEHKTLWDVLLELYEKYGYYQESQVSIEGKGEDGAMMMKKIMRNLHDNLLKKVADCEVIKVQDYLELKEYEGEEVRELDFPKSDVLKYFLKDGSWIAVRPSGTEPKIKFYYCIAGKDENDVELKSQKYKDYINEVIK